MISLNFLNPIMQKYGRVILPLVRSSLTYLWMLPSSFAGDAILKFDQRLWGAALLKLGGLGLYVLLLSALLLLRYRKLYAGEELSEGVAPSRELKRSVSSDKEESGLLSLLPVEVLAVFRKEALYLR